MKSKDKRAQRLNIMATKTKRIRKVTIEDLLARDDVNNILGQLNKQKPEISDMVAIWINKADKQLYYDITNGTHFSLATWMLESTKIDLLTSDDE